MAASVKESLMQDCAVPAEYKVPTRKVTVVGAGQVGMACAYSIMQQVTFLEGAISPIVPSAPKCSSHHYIFHRKYIFLSKIPFTANPSIDFSDQKPFYSQPNYSSW